MAITWIRSHIGIPGNEEVDDLASFASILGEVGGRNLSEGGFVKPRRRHGSHGDRVRGSGLGGQIGTGMLSRGNLDENQ